MPTFMPGASDIIHAQLLKTKMANNLEAEDLPRQLMGERKKRIWVTKVMKEKWEDTLERIITEYSTQL